MPVEQGFPRIKKLPDSVADQIAAGEVIERPASVVKELIENSIDAAARKIEIDIEAAGIGLICVKDDGHGICKDDLVLALQPHATSKLQRFSDLAQIASLGFRGEAIPSIASVSRFELISKSAGADRAWSVTNALALKPAAHAVGTTVRVNDLFFSTPGRRKFLKSEKTEYLHIQSLIRAMALSHFSIGLVAKHHDRYLVNLPACDSDLNVRVAGICGRTFINKSVAVDVVKNDMYLWGWLGLEAVSRSQSDRQYFYVNGRMVRDKHIYHAIRLAYGNRIVKGRFPSFVLHLQIDPSAVDVNVHPAKSEVRFSSLREVHDFIYGSILADLNKRVYTTDSPPGNGSVPGISKPAIQEHNAAYRVPGTATFDPLTGANNRLDYIVLLNGRFIIASVDAAAWLIDVPKANRLVTAQQLFDQFQTSSVKKRPILVPVSYELKLTHIDRINKNTASINRWGFELQQVSPSQVLVRAIPACLPYADVIPLLHTLVHTVSDESDRKIADALAKHVDDAGTAMDEDGMQRLVNRIRRFDNKPDERKPLPWRRLDRDTLVSLLES